MFQFANIEYLWLLVIIPIIVVAYIFVAHRKRKQLLAFGDPTLVAELMPNASHKRPIIKFTLEMLALTMLIIALARPQYGTKEETVKREGIEVMLALDISNSMMAEDVVPNRLDRAKQLFSKLVDQMIEDKVGVVVFAGDAFVQLPITADYVSAKMYLDHITPSLIKKQGTDIAKAITTSIAAFGTQETTASRVIILLTDGEDHEEKALEAAKLAKEKGIEIIMVGIGKTEGAPIPIPGTNTFRKDKQGNVVVSKLNEAMCQEIASAANGVYVRCDNTNTALRVIEKEIEKLATAEIETKVFTDLDEQYQSFVIIALLLLLIDFFVFTRKNKRLSKINLFEAK